ncbi:hypothetical protein PV04_02293 [Phialophora macrospora]|uniref:Uncharacterized protein n=1 Tax=Phialophora macrospora TaxID=1851006 RepID=A0A0D2CXV1_9EURO|nr:hypothetical protein PV04_02293 [Phialophora macrospora]
MWRTQTDILRARKSLVEDFVASCLLCRNPYADLGGTLNPVPSDKQLLWRQAKLAGWLYNLLQAKGETARSILDVLSLRECNYGGKIAESLKIRDDLYQSFEDLLTAKGKSPLKTGKHSPYRHDAVDPEIFKPNAPAPVGPMWTKTPSPDTDYQTIKALVPQQAASVTQGEGSIGSRDEYQRYWTNSEIDALFKPDD